MAHPLIATFAVVGLCLLSSAVAATEIFVNNQTGSDAQSGTRDAPLRSARRAMAVAQAGDVVHLLPPASVYREMITLADKRDLTIEGNDCIISGADPLPADPAAWEAVGDQLHRIKLHRTLQDRHILVVGGTAVMMGRTKYMINPLAGVLRRDGFDAFRTALRAQYPALEDLQVGQFAWEPIDERFGWLYVKGPLANLEWAVRTQGVYTDREVHNVTIRNLHARHALNDGFNIHGNAQGIRLLNVSGTECFDNGISPHGACSFHVQDSRFVRNEMAVGNDFLTDTHFLRCHIAESTHEEIMIIGGRHRFEDCQIRAAGPVAVRLIYRKPGRDRPAATREIAMSGKDPDTPPRYVFQRCTLDSIDAVPSEFIVGPHVHLILDQCTFQGIRFRVDPAAEIEVTGSASDGQTLTVDALRNASS